MKARSSLSGEGAGESHRPVGHEQHLTEGNAAHAKVRWGEFGVLVGIDLARRKRPPYSSASFSSIGFKTSGSAPRRPEIDEHGRFGGRPEDLCLEISMETSNRVGGHGGFPEGCRGNGMGVCACTQTPSVPGC